MQWSLPVGIGENSAPIRQLTLARLSLLGFKVNEQANLANRFGKESNQGIITEQGSTIAMVIATNEELIIARDTLELVSALSSSGLIKLTSGL